MVYTSTRDNTVRVDSATAIMRGISPDGGLYVPVELPKLSYSELCSMVSADYQHRAVDILGRFLTDFTDEELSECVKAAYEDKFGSDTVAPVASINDGRYILELWHGPTCAFKDMALQLLPHLLTRSVKKCGDDHEIVILVATSGDTGKAALEGFADVPGTRIIVFYPDEGVSNIQKLQMTTQEGDNVGVCAVWGNFDDAQTGVKMIFTNDEVKAQLEKNGMAFSSANSINWGRLVPQIVYYFSAYLDLMQTGEMDYEGEEINIAVPTGNFGNILAAFYAKMMGLPVKKLICASNANNVLTEFLTTGVYDRNRKFHTTMSPSMDILISSNLERLLFHLTDGDSARVKGWMEQLSATGRYEVDDDVKQKLFDLFWAGCCDDGETQAQIKELFDADGYLCDTHTAVGLHVYTQYRSATEDVKTPAVIASTASPYKFAPSVLGSFKEPDSARSEFENIDELSVLSSCPVPAPLAALESKSVRFDKVCKKEDMTKAVFDMLGIGN
ncbi:MAG: threonine synthase [Ruminococcaceae bacterium]|nr:threonine synthase [Oscillospiraceae bacterium]